MHRNHGFPARSSVSIAQPRSLKAAGAPFFIARTRETSAVRVLQRASAAIRLLDVQFPIIDTAMLLYLFHFLQRRLVSIDPPRALRKPRRSAFEGCWESNMAEMRRWKTSAPPMFRLPMLAARLDRIWPSPLAFN
jgi:hypothetical protein